ncbi:hypothetical protein ElyMa_004854700 [Elysia marginata]|uniref:Uncharacterized protein n=1 Tax=Elysia marginata TaxID=1093978 RepID=A0AAV4IPM7_9GAST|nr:hypothetical protein ElyMa_004854700 [Elysia marginata]
MVDNYLFKSVKLLSDFSAVCLRMFQTVLGEFAIRGEAIESPTDALAHLEVHSHENPQSHLEKKLEYRHELIIQTSPPANLWRVLPSRTTLDKPLVRKSSLQRYGYYVPRAWDSCVAGLEYYPNTTQLETSDSLRLVHHSLSDQASVRNIKPRTENFKSNHYTC